MSDRQLRELERAALTGGAPEQTALMAAQRKAGFVEEYVACTRCRWDTRLVRSHGGWTLCDACDGQGWTEVRLVPPR